jgi:hemerythrin-like domain-containing protein
VTARAIGIIRDEHRSLAAVLHAWMHTLAHAEQAGEPPDPAVMRAIVHYVKTFPVALHHPKEESHLFKRLRERTTAMDAELDELERQHERDRQLVDELARLVERLASADAWRDAARALARAVSDYATFLWDHMGREEGVILPAAQRWLRAEDWTAIDTAFAENRDPRFGGDADREYRHLFSRIVNLEAARGG